LVSDAEAKELLAKRAKEGKLEYEQKNALAHLKKFVKLSSSKVTELLKELEGVQGLREREKIAIVNFLPTDRDDLRAVLHKQYTAFSPEQLDKIIEIVKKHI